MKCDEYIRYRRNETIRSVGFSDKRLLKKFKWASHQYKCQRKTEGSNLKFSALEQVYEELYN